jgi:hypothetical protein
MTRGHAALALSLLLTPGCRHDEAALAPQLDDVPAWLRAATPACEQCLMTTCGPETEACIEDPACHATFATCGELDPSCAVLSPVHRAYASCYAAGCRVDCDVEARELSCVGNFDWKGSTSERIEIELAARALTGAVLPMHVEVCTGFESVCDPQSATVLVDEAPRVVSFKPSIPGLTPYFRATGEPLMPMLFVESREIPSGHRIYIPQVTRRGFAFLMNRIDAPPDPARGTLSLMQYDCSGIGVEGVRFELYREGIKVEPDGRTTQYYYEGVQARKPPALSVTRPPLFWGGFVNLAPGLYDVRAYRGDQLVGRAAGTVVLADTVTHATLFPLSRAQQAQLP